MNLSNYESVIGLEIHVELKTRSKMFCGCYADWFGRKPNSNTCPICLGLPGALPVPNKKAIEWCVMLGLALNCEIPQFSKFDRKNYFYPDLAKGYQISQYDRPFAVNGQLKIKDQSSKVKVKDKIIRIRRVHLEEDTGKLLHDVVDGKRVSLIDFNRGGVPLVEIVTEPDIRSSEEARVFLKKLYQIIRYIGISDADMEKGSMRLEPNISVKLKTDKDLPNYKVEVKNINSFNFAKKAIDFEIVRHLDLLSQGETPKQETRGWDEKKGITYSQRSKEEAHDYRYFPEPDIPPIRWTEFQISNYKLQIPELPDDKLNRFIKDYGLSEYDSTILTDELETANYFEKAFEQLNNETMKQLTPKTIANWIINKKV
ncbi:Asp-tRNA(Asn)/Glu-tRNA(Gln) amidotransferase subunit GatB, partial [Candidatus Gottesmanbacteria bacterium]|nr:Asp-tRNA(Asn)/Glu-tRNA(Gln) amidotransferase subunit GatB [Candidatus Gottesmanbacteria bacterium]